ncbi:hypothetical protein [Terricaulis silvestris]|uniref:Uncharacterized protein n=1 Tax=Terricaulis silvestris TaxID=2686094 RepID=A0A6I6MLJ7_9CAUL|nr:hypothetical protein [Terricaulis silvestris]QGZ93864.1 hypothetical protein DSM104635_00678 [Terricaulis silvestris]
MFIAAVLTISALIAASPPTVFALLIRAPRLAAAVAAVGIAAPVLFMIWIPVGVEGDFYTHLGAFLMGMPTLVAVTCLFLCAIVWFAWWLRKRNANTRDHG